MKPRMHSNVVQAVKNKQNGFRGKCYIFQNPYLHYAKNLYTRNWLFRFRILFINNYILFHLLFLFSSYILLSHNSKYSVHITYMLL